MRRSEVIILGTTRKRRIGNLTFGRTTDFVLDHAPCEVLLNLVPRDILRRARASWTARAAGAGRPHASGDPGRPKRKE